MPAAQLGATRTCFLAGHNLFVRKLTHDVTLSTARAVDEGYGVHQECSTIVSATAPKPIHISVINNERVRPPVMRARSANRPPTGQTMRLRRIRR